MIGLLGGAFNPIHIGHLTLAEEARAQLGLEQVVLLPSYSPPHKGIAVSYVHRLNMCRMARAGNHNIGVSNAEYDVGKDYGTTLTIDVLKKLDTNPDDHCFIMGGDSVQTFPTWDDPDGICERITLAVCSRPRRWVTGGGNIIKGNVAETSAFPDHARVLKFDVPGLEISSTAVRTAMETGDAWRYLVPDPVYQYIKRHNLYESN